jgi:hypothetical protein
VILGRVVKKFRKLGMIAKEKRLNAEKRKDIPEEQ